ncbi:microtubule-associated proteins 1A/1B light chain 3B-like [Hydractinia symbiolongicarpus]|uniref:microtubule-associated proteins 1A/1B light chain 3B-like n=1 Tax=Hydractinia symbiolongicarpus TaxID=13093 RepID=UPI00254F6673|nr:microtubule-associated proteins 1A/1B light chain 3B-like [Hydractinia symbiolongicarpus]
MSSLSSKCFKDKKNFHARQRDSECIMEQYSDKLPLIIERYKNEKALPVIDKIKFLVPSDMTIGTLNSILRRRLQLNSTQALFLLVNNRNMFTASMPICDVYRDEKDEDGFLYIVYASQEVFGS